MGRIWLVFAPILTCCLGCQTLNLPARSSASEVAHVAQSPQGLREQGQKAMRDGDSARAVYLFVRSLSLEEKWPANRLLTQAADHLSRGEVDTATMDLISFLKAYPEHSNVRFCLAEHLLNLGKPAEARNQFLQLSDRCPDLRDEDEHLLLHCHGRLTEIAETQNDAYAEHFHRGIGLYLLAVSTLPPGEDDPVISSESLLCKAMGELMAAQEARPSEAGPCWYLSCVYQKLGQSRLARRWLRAAQQAAPFAHLSAAEQRGLELAGRGLTERLGSR